MRIIFFLLIIFTLSVASAATVYTWVDQNGATVFSDQPQPGASSLNVVPPKSGSTAPSAPVAPTFPTLPSSAVTYEEIVIVVPEDQSTVRDNSGNMQVSVVVKPTLQKGDKVAILIDGKPVGQPQAATNFMLNAVDRGQHTLEADVVNSSGRVLIKSKSVTFFIHQAHIDASGHITS